MLIKFHHYTKDGKRQDHCLQFAAQPGMTLGELLKQVAASDQGYDFGPNGYEIDYYLYLAGNRILHIGDDISALDVIEVVPFVEGG
ncbi:MAG: hypothetical protein GX572_06340 [Clostridia bacterium]|nr:hypothetical protein [Clostridia bacterium]